MRTPPLLLALVFLGACVPPEAVNPWSEFILLSATLEADGLHVVSNREQIKNLPSQGGGEGGTTSRRRVEAWWLAGDAILRNHVGGTTTPSGSEGPWQGEWRAGHLWTRAARGLFKDDQPTAAPFDTVRASSLGRSLDGGVAYAMLRDDSSVAVWFEGESSAREFPQLGLTLRNGLSGQAIVLSSGPKFGLAVGHGTDGIPTPTSVWAEGGPVTSLDGGVPLAFYADDLGTRTVLRHFTSPGTPAVYDDALYDDAGVHALTQTNGPIAYTSLDNASIFPCLAEGFDTRGTALTLTGHAAGFTVRAGAQTYEVPADGSNDVAWCSISADAQAIHLAWLENGERHAAAPTPHLLHYVTILNGVQRAARPVDIAVELLDTQP